MKSNWRHALLAFSGGVLITAGVAYAQTPDRYLEALPNVDKATALLNAITPVNAHEKKQHDKALADLANAREHIECARLRAADPGAACP
jgi:hypothetical protein